jgi:hypothetical protein
MHAAARNNTEPGQLEAAEITLHKYKIRNGTSIKLMLFSDNDHFASFVQQRFGNNPYHEYNNAVSADVIAHSLWGTVMNGYTLLRDSVRGEQEYVLFESGLANLERIGTQTINISREKEGKSEFVDAETGELLARYSHSDDGPGKLNTYMQID